MIAYRATLDVPRELVRYLSRLLAAERRARGTRKGTRKLTCWYQALMVLAWFRKGEDKTLLGAGFGVSRATAYRYVAEGIAVLTAQAPDLREALKRVAADGWSHVILDGKLFATDRLAETTTSVKGEQIDAWYCGKHRDFGANIQALMRPDGLPIWTSDAAPGHLHDFTCAQLHDITGALYWAASQLNLTHPGRRRLRRRGPRYPHAGQATRGRPPARHRQPRLQPASAIPTRPRRTGLRPAHRPLVRPAPHHRQPPQRRRYRPRRTRTHPI